MKGTGPWKHFTLCSNYEQILMYSFFIFACRQTDTQMDTVTIPSGGEDKKANKIVTCMIVMIRVGHVG